jgi:uncharacterized protein YciI
MKYVVLYQSADKVAGKAKAHFAGHWARCRKFHSEGKLLEVGTFADPQRDGSMAVFSTREAAEDFVAGDPFVLNQVIANWRLLEWNEVLGAEG